MLNKKSVDDLKNLKGKRVLVRCDFNVPLKNGVITDETRIVAALPTIQKLISEGAKVILCSHLGKVKNGPNEGESLAPVAVRLSEKLGKDVVFVADYNVTGEAATKAVEAMKDGDVVLLQNTRFRGAEETKNGEQFSKELADLADDYVCDAFGSSHRAHASVEGVTKFITAKGGTNAVGYLMQKEIDFLGNAVENPVRPFVAILGGAKVADKLNVISNLLEKCDTLIIGGGMAFTFLKAEGKEIGKSLVDDTKLDYCKEMLEKAEKLGKKLFITGKGRCNITNACPAEEFLTHVVTNPRFLYSTFSQFNNEDMIEYLEKIGLPVKTERGQRVFPQSDRSSDVIQALKRECEKGRVKIYYHTEVKELLFNEEKDQCIGVLLSDGRKMEGDSVILACGGFSYASTGSDGAGYILAKQAGHKIKSIEPSLVPFEMKENWCKELMGLTLKNVMVRIKTKKKTIYEGFGEFLFTHFGVSGPLVLTASTCLGKYQKELEAGELKLFLDLKASLTPEQLDKRFLREFDTYRNKNISNVMERLLPKKMIPVFLDMAQIPEDKKIRDISKKERRRMIELMKNFEMHISGVRGFNEAIVTRGGVNVKEINPATMESKKVKHLFFAGEIMDLDAVTGGYNLQIAWTTGYAAGKNA